MADYSWWEAALGGKIGPIHENHPRDGFYRKRKSKEDRRWQAIAIWHDGEQHEPASCLIDGEPGNAEALWTWVCRNPIPYEFYKSVAEDGQPWPSEGPEWPDEQPRRSVKNATGPVVGSNAPDGADIKETIIDLAEKAEAWLKSLGKAGIRTSSDADKAANWKTRFTELEKETEATRKLLKEPYTQAGKCVDANWVPVREMATAMKGLMVTALTPWQKAEQERLAEEARKATEEVAGGDSPAEAPKVRSGTPGRRAVSLVTQRELRFRDSNLTIDHYRHDKRFWLHPDAMRLMGKMAVADMNAGLEVPGAYMHEEQVAR